ncbi:hypothetical protein E4U55_004870 [Claviceps digitariae]|nr:hypothetical protein E4U55_004870 [Claviceps digitariae]
MVRLSASYNILTLCAVIGVQSGPMMVKEVNDASLMHHRGIVDDWQASLSDDTRHRLKLAQEKLGDESDRASAFRNDTIMRVNIEREALDLPLVDLQQAFGMQLPASRSSVAMPRNKETSDTTIGPRGQMLSSMKRGSGEEFREEVYMRSGAMAYPNVAKEKRGSGEEFREEVYMRSGAMAYPNVAKEKRGSGEEFREEVYMRSGAMAYPNVAEKREVSNDDQLLDRNNLALGAIERINIARRVQGQPEITLQQAEETGSHGDEYLAQYWQSSMNHAGFWAGDQVAGKPNFMEGGQLNGFGFTQSTYHKLHCLANLRMMLAWHITGNGSKMTRDMNAHAIHCLEYVRARELEVPDLNEEPIDTVDYKGMGIH